MKKKFDLYPVVRSEAPPSSVFRYSRKKMWVFLSLAVLTVFFAVLFKESKSESAIFYPESCLGGWENPQLAQGPAETESLEDFNRENSAVLFNSLAEIYCGGFSGEMPEGSSPQQVILKLGLSVRTREVFGSSTEEFNPEALNQGTTTEIILPLSQAEPDPSIDREEVVLTPQPSSDETIDKIESPLPEVSSLSFWSRQTWLKQFTRLVYAEEPPQESLLAEEAVTPSPQESTPPEETVVSIEPTPSLAPELSPVIPTIEEAASSSPELLPEMSPTETPSLLQESSELPFVLPEEILSVTPDVATSSESDLASSSPELLPEPSPSEAGEGAGVLPTPQNNLFEIFYSFDGHEWLTLGMVDLFDFEDAVFEIADFDWDRISSLQVKLMPLPNELSESEILLEHMALEVLYEARADQDGIFFEPESEEEIITGSDNEEGLFMESEPTVITEVEPPLKQRRLVKKIKIDDKADHRCSVSPFSTHVSAVDSGLIQLMVSGVGEGSSVLEIGSLPDGINVVFANNQDYVYRPLENEMSFNLEITKQFSSQKGNFNIPIIYTQEGGRDSSIICQFNIVNL